MAWSFTDNSLMIPIRLVNPFLDTHYPPAGLVMALLDTGFTGFLLTPSEVFRALRLDELKTRPVSGQLANGRKIELQGAFGLLEIPEIQVEAEGLIESNPDIEEILLGVRGIAKLRTTIDGCEGTLTVDEC